MNLFKIGEGGKTAVESVSKKKISQNCTFHFNCEVVSGNDRGGGVRTVDGTQ